MALLIFGDRCDKIKASAAPARLQMWHFWWYDTMDSPYLLLCGTIWFASHSVRCMVQRMASPLYFLSNFNLLDGELPWFLFWKYYSWSSLIRFYVSFDFSRGLHSQFTEHIMTFIHCLRCFVRFEWFHRPQRIVQYSWLVLMLIELIRLCCPNLSATFIFPTICLFEP